MSISTAAFGGKHTPKQVLLDALNHADDFKCCVLVYVDQNDYVYTAWSDGSMLKRIGMMDVAQIRMLEAGQEDE
jgi:hypothetical protein